MAKETKRALLEVISGSSSILGPESPTAISDVFPTDNRSM